VENGKEVKKYLRWLQKDVGINESSVKLSALAHHTTKELQSPISQIESPILVCMTDTHFGFYHSGWFSTIRGAFDLRLIRKIQCNRKALEMTVCAIKQQELRFCFTDPETYETFSDKLLLLRRSVMSPIRPQYQEMLDQLNSRASSKLAMVNNLLISEPFHPSLHFWQFVFSIESGQIAEVKKQILDNSQFFKSYAKEHPVAFADLIADIDFTHAEYVKLCSHYKLSLDSSDHWRLICRGALAFRQGDGLTGALAFDSAKAAARNDLSGSDLQDLLAEINYLLYRLSHHFQSHWSKEGIEIAMPSPAPGNDREAIRDFDTPPRLSTSNMEKDWFNGILAYKKWSTSTDRCASAWSALRSGDWKRAEKIVCEPGIDKWCKQYRSLPARDPRFFWSAIIACEILIKQGHKHKALEILDEASQRMFAITESSDSLWIQHATVISNFYRSIAEDNIDLAHLYLTQLPDEFQWGRTLIDLHFNETSAVIVDLEATLADFHKWISATISNDFSQPIQSSLKEFNLALSDNQLRIVVGGETSAGKSTFINRLLGYPLLVVDRQESTAVPTHISYADDWGIQIDFKNDSCPRCNTWNDPKEGLEQIKRLVNEYGSLAEKLSQSVERIRITGPIAMLSKGIELIDNPGLNAHSLRTAYAQQTLRLAHACLFVMDARNALKAGEMSAIVLGDEQLGRTIFILNKADLVQNSNEFDTDDNPLQSVLAHVSHELGQRGTSHRDVEMYAVSSLNQGEYQDVFDRLAARLQHLAELGRKNLLLYRAQRIAQEIAETSSHESMKEVIACQLRTNNIRRAMPEDPSSLRKFLRDNSLKLWNSNFGIHKTAIQNCLNHARTTTLQTIANSASEAKSPDDFATFLRNHLDRIILEQITTVSQTRRRCLTQLTNLIISDLSDQLDRFYCDIAVDSEVNFDSFLSQLSPAPLPRSSSFFGLVEKELASVGGISVAAGVPFATAGFFIAGPVGAAAGYAIGSMFGNANARSSVMKKTNEELNRLINSRFWELEELIDSDFISSDDSYPNALQLIFAEIDHQMDRFENKVRDRILQIEADVKSSEQWSHDRQRLAMQAERWRRTLSRSG
jgi:GTPase Era involved in 16S rRNA processing